MFRSRQLLKGAIFVAIMAQCIGCTQKKLDHFGRYEGDGRPAREWKAERKDIKAWSKKLSGAQVPAYIAERWEERLKEIRIMIVIEEGKRISAQSKFLSKGKYTEFERELTRIQVKFEAIRNALKTLQEREKQGGIPLPDDVYFRFDGSFADIISDLQRDIKDSEKSARVARNRTVKL